MEGSASPEQEKLANDWYYSFKDDNIDIPADIAHLRSEMEKRIWRRLMKTVETGAVPLYRRKWYRLSAAAVLLLLITAAAFLFSRQPMKNNPAAKSSLIENDVPPGGNKAILTLANGRTILLDSTQNGDLAEQGDTKITKPENGLLAYQAGATNANTVFYNTLSTPCGGQFRLVLPDGSKVWLNAASSIKYPTVFEGNERRVEINGEAYFEIAHRYAEGGTKRVPFIVSITGGAAPTEIEVLGTHFNVMAYTDEADIKTTLLEGSVKLKSGNTSGLLQPGQQFALSRKNNGLQLVGNADIDATMAWKNGYFQFRSTDVQTVMRQVARWYDVKVAYEGNVAQYFNGRIPRSVSAATLFKVLELTGGVHFKMEGRKITVVQ